MNFISPDLYIPMIISLAGLIISVIAMVFIKRAKESLNWYRTTGTILSSSINKEYFDEITYEPEISYSYMVENVLFTSDKIISFFNYGSSFGKRSFDIIRKYPTGSRITVYYNPQRHDISVLEPGIKPINWIFLFLGLALFIVPIVTTYCDYFK
jgi:hypothetical protein